MTRTLTALVLLWSTALAHAQTFQDVMERLLATSVFGADTPPQNLLPNVAYDPLLVSVAASLRSREPKRDGHRWRTIELAPLAGSLCPGPIKAHVKVSRRHNAETFVLFPGSFATWQRGSFVNLPAAQLEQMYDDPNLIEFAGFLTVEFLRGTCNSVPWDNARLAHDIYRRLRAQLGPLFTSGQNGVVGFSGGANFALGVLAADARSGGDQRLFELGGLAFSPILHGQSAFETLDLEYTKGHLPKSQDLLHYDVPTVWFLLRQHALMNWQNIGNLFQHDPDAFTARFYNQFRHDLADSRGAVGVTDARDLGYYETFIAQSFGGDASLAGDELNRRFEFATDPGREMEKIDRPTLVFFSQDDPVLSGPRHSAQPTAVTRILRHATENPSIKVYNPKFGGHTGALLDLNFGELLRAVFKAGH